MGGSEGGAEAFFALGVDAWVYCFQVFDCFDKGKALRDGEDAVLFCFIFVNGLVKLEYLPFPRGKESRKSGDEIAYD